MNRKQLIQTDYTYRIVGGRKRFVGNFLGRKPATYRTIRRRITQACRQFKIDPGLFTDVLVGESFPSGLMMMKNHRKIE